MAEMMTADKADVGMYAKCGVRNAHAIKMMQPVTIPPNVVLTPDAELTADLPKDAVTGMDPTNDPNSWQDPRAIISCEASTE